MESAPFDRPESPSATRLPRSEPGPDGGGERAARSGAPGAESGPRSEGLEARPPGAAPARPWRRGALAWPSGSTPESAVAPVAGGTTLPSPAGERPGGAGVRSTCILLAGESAEELEGAGLSALGQSVPFDEVLVAEPDPEGSAGELERLLHTLAEARGEVVCFLRAQDRYEPDHLLRVLAFFGAHPDCGSVDVAYRRFGRREELVTRREGPGLPRIQAALARTIDPRRLPVPALSALAVRREVLAAAEPFPVDVLADWLVEPCEPLLRAALASGAGRGYLPECGVNVRVDDAALDSRRVVDPAARHRRRLALARLLAHLDRRHAHGPVALDLADLEYRGLTHPTRAQLGAYLELVLESRLPLASRMRLLATILLHHLRVGSWRGR